MVNPYQVHDSPMDRLKSPPAAPRGSIGPLIVALVFVIASLIGLSASYFPLLRSLVMPRFGWIGLVLCMNPVIFLSAWLASHKPSNLIAAAWMCFVIAGIQLFTLLWQGTVSVVNNEFADRLHSSWFWSVILFVLIAMYLLYEARAAGVRERWFNQNTTATGSELPVVSGIASTLEAPDQLEARDL